VLKKEQAIQSTDATVASLLKEADKDGDGKIDYEEFLSIMWAQSHPEESAEEKAAELKKDKVAAPAAAAAATSSSGASSATSTTPNASSSSSSTAATTAAKPAAMDTADNHQQVITRTINQGKSARLARVLTWMLIAGTLVSFVLAIALRLWFDDSAASLNCGLWSCCDDVGGCGTIDESSLTSDALTKLRVVRAFVILGCAASLISLAIATLAYFAEQDLMGKYLTPLLLFQVVCSVIAFAVYVQEADIYMEKSHLAAGFGFCVLAGILSLIGVPCAFLAQKQLVVQQ